MKKAKGINLDLIAGILCTIIGALTFYASRTYPNLRRDDLIVGADLFPTIAAAGMLICAVVILIKAIVALKYRPAYSKEEIRDFLRVAVVAVFCIAYVALMSVIGFLVGGIIVMALVMIAYGNKSWIQITLISVLVPLVLFVTFKFALGVQLPMGILSFLGI